MSYVLLAEPDAATAQRLARTLTSLTGLPCHVARDGQEGHTLLAQHGNPALLVTELSLPKRDGFALIRGVRRSDPRRTTRVIALSAAPAVRTSAQDLAGELAPLVVLSKPVEPVLFERAVKPPARVAPPRGSVGMPSLPPLPPPPRVSPAAEQARLRRIDEMGIVDDAPQDADLERIVTDVAASFGVPTALVTVVLESRQWVKSHVGLTGELLENRGSARAISFCHHVVEGRAPLVVADARTHPVFAKNPLVTSGQVTGYAGAPIVTSAGEVLGSLCIIDTKPLEASADDVARLGLIARRVAGELQLAAARRKQQRSPRPSAAPPADTTPERAAVLRALDSALDLMPSPAMTLDHTRRVLSVNRAFEELFSVARDELVGVRRETVLTRIAQVFADPDDASSRLLAPAEGPFVLCEDLPLAGDARRVLRWQAGPVDVPGGFVQLATGVVREATLR